MWESNSLINEEQKRKEVIERVGWIVDGKLYINMRALVKSGGVGGA